MVNLISIIFTFFRPVGLDFFFTILNIGVYMLYIPVTLLKDNLWQFLQKGGHFFLSVKGGGVTFLSFSDNIFPPPPQNKFMHMDIALICDSTR